MRNEKIYFEGISLYKNVPVFRNANNRKFYVKEFKGGVAKLESVPHMPLISFFETVESLFSEESNFKEELFRVFKCDKSTVFKGVAFSCNGVDFFITKENAEKDKMYHKWISGIEEKQKNICFKFKTDGQKYNY